MIFGPTDFVASLLPFKVQYLDSQTDIPVS
jgi:hypothetical protein